MVERIHRQFKASLKARVTTSSWCTQLPIILLGMRSALKEDLSTSSTSSTSTAEMVYGTTLHLPGNCFEQTPQMTSPGLLANQLLQYMVQLKPSPVITRGQFSFHVLRNLKSATHVFIQHNAHCTPLQRPYEAYSISSTGLTNF